MDEEKPAVPYGWAFVFSVRSASSLFLPAVKELQFHLIDTGTVAYAQMMALRMDVLLRPIGIPPTYIDQKKEAGDTLICAYAEGELAGCCILTEVSNDTVQLRQMAVATALQGRGVGKAIIAFAESIARQNGYAVVMMNARDTVLPFYLKCGYTIFGDRFFEVGIAHHKMQKRLTAE